MLAADSLQLTIRANIVKLRILPLGDLITEGFQCT